MKSFSYEKRYLKRPRLGPPDFYPQEPKQKEDELTLTNVKHGFACLPQLTEEYGSAKDYTISASKIASYYNAILSKKDEKNTLGDSGRKRQQINPKDNFWPVTARTKTTVEQWFRDLAGTKSLLVLSKKAPNFNKREDIFPLLCEHQVPLLRAAWFIKYSSAYTVAVSEAKIKKRQMPDPTQEWTGTLLRFLKEQLTKLAEYYSSLTQSVMNDEQKVCFKLWQYTTQLMRHLYQEGLLELTEVLHWILENVEGCKAWAEDQLLRLILPLTLQYLGDITQSELLSRKVAYVAASRLAHLSSSQGTAAPGAVSPDSPAHSQSPNNLNGSNIFGDLLTCPHHRDIILALSAITQVITVECSTALVWNSIGEGKAGSVLNGSSMDLLPCPPSALPVPTRLNNPHIKSQVKYWENIIKERSSRAENRWSCDKWEESSAGVRTQAVLSALEALDRHSFSRVDAGNSLDTLYAKIFPQPIDKATYNVNKDEAIVELLCWWAVRSNRYGEHRAMAVAKLLERRNMAVVAAMTPSSSSSSAPGPGGGTGAESQEDTGSAQGQNDKDQADIPSSLPVFQPLLINFLDNDAPVLEEGCAASSSVQFTNLVHLFAELTRHDVFSHDAYMCTLISRGDLLSAPNINANNVGTPHPNSNKPLETPTTQIYLDSDPTALFELKPNKLPYGQDHGRGMECDDSKIDDDLDKLLQTIKEEQQNSMDAPDSPKVDDGMVGVDGSMDPSADPSGRPSRHLLYTTHFPLPQDESCVHECNQRHVLLYGVGRLRDDARHAIKRVVKDISKLFSKKFSIDVAEGGKVKKHSRNEFNFESTTSRVQNLSYFDQHVVTWQCSTTVLEMISSFAAGNSNYLPVQEHVAFLFDLMELALNINGLIDVCIQMLKEMPEVESQLVSKGSNLVRSYTSSLVLYIVGVLRRYHSCLLLSGDETVAVFEGLCKVVKHISNPADCSSAERCILSHLYDLYTCCTLLKTRPHGAEPFSNAYPKIRAALYNSLTPSQSGNQTATCFMSDVIINIRKSMKIESLWTRQLNESSSNRYSFVCNVVIAVCTTNDIDRLNDLGHLCSELTACCNLLSSEWLGVLMALCYTSKATSSYSDVLSQVDVQDLTLHNSLSLFTSILVARHCFSLEDFVVHVALPSLLAVYNEGRGDADIDAEAGARLTLHLLLRLFKTIEVPQPALYSVGTSPQPVPVNAGLSSIKLSCDRHLLAAAHHNIRVGPVLAVLKAILVVGDSMAGRGARARSRPHSRATPPQGAPELSISHILGTSDLHTAAAAAASRDDLMDLGGLGVGGGLSELAQFVLKEMCSEEWVLEHCLRRPEDLCTPDMLLDSMLSAKQAQRLLHMICYPERPVSAEVNLDQKTLITNILENVELWTLRVSWLDMQLMLKQFSPGSPDLNQWLDTVAKAAINLFNIHSGPPRMDSKARQQAMWLVAPLIAKMPSNVQGRVLKVAGQVLESCSWLVGGGANRCKGGTPTRPTAPPPTTLVHHHQPFLALVLTCLKGQDDQRETLLNSLHSQLTQALQTAKEDKGNILNEVGGRAKRGMEEALALRFSLLGGMFDSVQRSSTLTTDWAILLVQLVTHSLIDLNNNSELFYTVIDMLATLIHSNLVSDSQSEKGEENRKHYQNLMKKLKKEVGEKMNPSLQVLRQLLPIAKRTSDVIACTQMGLLTDMKGNKINFDSNEKQGLQVVEKQRVSCWDLLEGSKNPAPLSWPWFGAMRVERKPLPYEETHKLLQCHSHSLVKSPNHYLDPPPLPPEDIDPPKPMKGALVESAVTDSPGRGGKRGGKHPPGAPRPQRKKQAKPGAAPQPAPPQPQGGQYGPYPPTAGPAPQPQWGQPTPPYPPHHPNQLYYQQQQQMHQVGAGGGAVTAGGGGRVNPSKQALSNMLRMRLPNQYMPPQQPQQQQPPPPPQIPQNFQSMQRQNMFRQGMQSLGPGGMGQQGGGGQGMGGMGPIQPPQQQMFPTQPQIYPNMQQQAMPQNYGAYSGGGMVSNAGMFPDQNMMRQAEYQPRMRPPYMQGQAPNVTMTSMAGPLSQPAPPYTRPAAPQQPFPQMSQQRIRLMAIQQQQQQQQQQQNPQQQPGMMRQMQHPGNQGAMQHPANQASMYQQQPPPY